jgi:hypothetical protein
MTSVAQSMKFVAERVTSVAKMGTFEAKRLTATAQRVKFVAQWATPLVVAYELKCFLTY